MTFDKENHQMKKSDINPMPPNFAKYIDLVADVELEKAFDDSGRQLNELDKDVLKTLGDKRYAPGKWTVKDILQHLADSDRIMSYQALMLARKDESVLQGFDEKLHVKNANAHFAATPSTSPQSSTPMALPTP